MCRSDTFYSPRDFGVDLLRRQRCDLVLTEEIDRFAVERTSRDGTVARSDALLESPTASVLSADSFGSP